MVFMSVQVENKYCYKCTTTVVILHTERIRVFFFCMSVAHQVFLTNETVQMVISPVLLLDVGEDLHMLSSNLLAISQ